MGSSGFENWTQAKVEEHNARVESGRVGLTRQQKDMVIVKHLIENPKADVAIVQRNPENPQMPSVLRIQRQESTDIKKLNKTERAFYDLLITQGHHCVWAQAITLKLADDTRFTVDFVVFTVRGELIAYETKGFFRDDAKVKIKVAARMFPIFKFVLVEREKGGVWKYTDIKP